MVSSIGKAIRASTVALGLIYAHIAVTGTALATADSAVDSKQERRALAEAVELLDAWTGGDDDLNAAKKALDQALGANPDSPAVHRGYARYHVMNAQAQGKLNDAESLAPAERSLDRAIALAPNYAEAFVLRGHLYRLLDRQDDAIAALTRAEQLGTDDPWLDLNWSDLLSDDEKHDEAITRCRRVLAREALRPRMVQAGEYCLLRSYVSLGRLDDADAVHRKKIARDPKQGSTHADYAAFLLCRREQPQSAAQVALKALPLPDPERASLVLAAALYSHWSEQVLAGRKKEADAAWDAATAFLIEDPAQLAQVVCGDKSSFMVRRALRDTNRGAVIAPMLAVVLAAESSPRSAPGIFGFKVVATGRVGGEIFLNSQSDYRDQRNLTIRFSPKAVAAFRDLHGEDPDVVLKGKRITVVGAALRKRIDLRMNGVATGKYYYQTHIDIFDPVQVEVLDPTIPPPPPKRESVVT